jgi:hypothetical protein
MKKDRMQIDKAQKSVKWNKDVRDSANAKRRGLDAPVVIETKKAKGKIDHGPLFTNARRPIGASPSGKIEHGKGALFTKTGMAMSASKAGKKNPAKYSVKEINVSIYNDKARKSHHRVAPSAEGPSNSHPGQQSNGTQKV